MAGDVYLSNGLLVDSDGDPIDLDIAAPPSGAVDSVNGRTGAVVLTSTDVGLANVNNTSDANKPVSTAQQTALDAKAPAANPTFTGTVTIPDGALAIADTSGLQAALDAKAPAANPTFTGTVTIPDNALAIADTSGLQTALDAKQAITAVLTAAIAAPVSHGSTGATETFDATAAQYHYATLDQNCVFTLTAGASGVLWELVLELLQDGTGSRTVTWPASVKWTAATAPTLTTTASRRDFVTLWTRDGGTTWWGTAGPQNLV